jgi:DNA-binding NarL/FixJ family response regulator
VLLDSGLPENGTIRLLKNLKEAGSNATIFILSSSYDDHILKECKCYSVDFIFDKYQDFVKIPGVINAIAGIYRIKGFI